MNFMHGFYQGTIDLHCTNKANIIMIPKNDNPQSTTDFRPMSMINILPKLISKILANMLRGELPQLIYIRQTAFVQGRQLSEKLLSYPRTAPPH
jgi:hypothetical protein